MLIAAALLAGAASKPDGAPAAVTVLDTGRGREIPVLVYGGGGARRRLAVISHGYGGGSADYGFIAAWLVERGYVVASVQHVERPGDPPMVNSGNLGVLRRPVWRVGVESIAATIGDLRRRGWADGSAVVLLGHSNGGDMSMMFASEHAADAAAAISLDNRRYPLPRTTRPRICSLRSSDLPADNGVLPSENEQQAFSVLLERSSIRHVDMSDAASEPQRSEVRSFLQRCLAPPQAAAANPARRRRRLRDPETDAHRG